MRGLLPAIPITLIRCAASGCGTRGCAPLPADRATTRRATSGHPPARIHEAIVTAADAEFAILAGQLQAMLDRATDGSEHERPGTARRPAPYQHHRRLRRRT